MVPAKDPGLAITLGATASMLIVFSIMASAEPRVAVAITIVAAVMGGVGIGLFGWYAFGDVITNGGAE
jgi:hypothetical protein